MIEVYKTDLINEQLAQEIKQIIEKEVPNCKISLDLEDSDRIVRVQASPKAIVAVESLLEFMLVQFEPLPA
ncbi:MAG: hypothetical protein AAFZ63_20395 [Bacteroidota bacterium]